MLTRRTHSISVDCNAPFHVSFLHAVTPALDPQRRSHLPPHSSRAPHASVQGVAHGGEDLVDGDLAVVVRVCGLAVKERCVAGRDFHHRENLIDSNRAAAVTVADACGWGRGQRYGDTRRS
jgi:hypothetical protein